MIDGRRILAVIAARGGSKGLPRKNVIEVGGKPLIAWTIDEAKKSKYIDRLILSSDDPEIIGVAKKWGCEVPFVRPAELATDATPSIEVVLHALTVLPGFDFVALLQPTSPLRTVGDIDGCIEWCFRQKAESCVSVTEAECSPYWMFSFSEGNRLNPILGDMKKANTRRQALPAVYMLSGAVYVSSVAWLLRTKAFVGEDTIGYVVPQERSLDIDTKLDLIALKEIIGDKHATL